MTRTVRLKVEPMTAESFSPYGEVWDAREHPADHRQSFQVAYDPEGKPTGSVMWQPYQTLTFTKLERHFHATHVFIPLSGSLAAVAVALGTDENDPNSIPDPDDVRAFLIDGTKGFCYKRATWHSLDRYILNPPGTTFITFNNSPNPTQTVDYMDGYSLTHTDLSTDTNPTRLEMKDATGVTFEIAL
ncbi:MAG: ureidoglycolate lyase [Dehalococcoidia bacterium]|nr:ureidoglycolate lyase [Dehalococcoidia bacterium]